MKPAALLQTALDAAQAADPIIRRYFTQGAPVHYKGDNSPVTDADIEAEQAIHQVIKARWPDHGFYGEETGRHVTDSEFTWLVDPIDGTKGFVRGYPMFSTQIALMHAGELLAGVSHAPLFNETCHAIKNGGAFLNNQPIRVSEINALTRAQVSVGNLRSLSKDLSRWAALGKLVGEAERTRGYGDFYHYHLLASGRMDAVIESDVNILDIAAVALIVTEAGGIFTDLYGAPVSMETGSVLAANRDMHAILLQHFQHSDKRKTGSYDG